MRQTHSKQPAAKQAVDPGNVPSPINGAPEGPDLRALKDPSPSFGDVKCVMLNLHISMLLLPKLGTPACLPEPGAAWSADRERSGTP